MNISSLSNINIEAFYLAKALKLPKSNRTNEKTKKTKQKGKTSIKMKAEEVDKSVFIFCN